MGELPRGSRKAGWLAATLAATATLGACGGGGGADSGGATASVSSAAPLAAAATPAATGAGGGSAGAATAAPLGAAQLAIAERVYAGTPRTPEGFENDPAPIGATGQVTTLHLKNSDAPSASSAGVARFELCTDDAAQATAWSEARAIATSPYADLVESNASPRAFELVRVPRGDATARVRHRIFRCSYLERHGSDLADESGTAGVLRARPADAAALRSLSEYLWQFTPYNNADHVVIASAAGSSSSAAASLAHAIEMARLVRGGAGGGCDRIDLLRWTHTLDVASGALARRLDTIGSFGARRDATSGVQGCTS